MKHDLRKPWCVRYFAFALLLTAFSDAHSTSTLGALEIRITDHKPGIDQFANLEVTMGDIFLHKKGFGRKDGWIRFSVESPAPSSAAIDIVPLKDGRYQSMGTGLFPVGAYDALKITFEDANGLLKRNDRPVLRADDTVVATAITINQDTSPPVVIDLYVEDQTEHEPPMYIVKVKEIRFFK